MSYLLITHTDVPLLWLSPGFSPPFLFGWLCNHGLDNMYNRSPYRLNELWDNFVLEDVLEVALIAKFAEAKHMIVADGIFWMLLSFLNPLASSPSFSTATCLAVPAYPTKINLLAGPINYN